jgi:hypothetical protein
MTTKTNNHQAFGIVLLLMAVLLTGIYSCNNNAATEEKKADSTAAIVDTTKAMTDTTKLPTDSSRDTKVPHQ